MKISWRGPKVPLGKSPQNLYVPPVTGYYIGYRPRMEHRTTPLYDIHSDIATDGGNEFVFKTIKSTASLLTETDVETFVLNNLKRATRYDIK